MKIYKILSIFLIVGLITQSCSEDFLDLKPISSSTTGNSFNTENDIEAALVAVYNSLHNEYYTWDNVLMGDVRSDNCYAGPPDDVDIWAYDQLGITSNNSRIFNNWRDFYLGIARANTVIDKIEEMLEMVEMVEPPRREVQPFQPFQPFQPMLNPSHGTSIEVPWDLN